MQVGDRGLIWVGWIVLITSAGIVVAVPILMLTSTSWVEGRGRLAEVLTEPGFGTAVAHSLALSAVVTGLAVPIGVTIALALRDPGLPGRAFWRAAVLVPLLIPDFVLGYSWLRAYARGGLTSELFGFVWTGVQGSSGVAVIVAVSAVPLVYLIIMVGLATRAEPITERAAHASGATALTVLRTITLPLLAPAIATSAVVVFVLTLGTFAVPQVIGTPAGFSTITTRIYADLTYSSDPQSFVDATTLAVLLVILTLVVVAPADVAPRQTAPAAPHFGDYPRLAQRRPARESAKATRLGGLPDRYHRLALAGAGQCGDHPSSRRAVDPGQLDVGQLSRCAHAAHRSGTGPQPPAFCGGRIDPPYPGADHRCLGSDAVGARDQCVDHPHPRASRLDSGDRYVARIRPVARRYRRDHPPRVPGQTLGSGASPHLGWSRSLAARWRPCGPRQRCDPDYGAGHRGPAADPCRLDHRLGTVLSHRLA